MKGRDFTHQAFKLDSHSPLNLLIRPIPTQRIGLNGICPDCERVGVEKWKFVHVEAGWEAKALNDL
uniref:Uncharacterized protein n=1 Tax=uncultured organism MedDCM-OCT-S01-C81 TaxID=743603 RepID=D6PJL9_9ZZZZ|nr:hypothetical protein [uncultured organism MedDCM-OCT-S01-C81]